MKELIEWLVSVEDLAARCYADAAARFADNAEFSGFLRHLAEDEAWHRRALERALEFAKTENLSSADIALNSALKARIENALRDADRELGAGTCTNETLLGCIVAAEYSEWNDIFLYVVNTLKERHREFAGAAAAIQQHKKNMARYLKTVPEGRAHLEKIERLPDVWKETILVVDDEDVLRKLFTDILSPLAAVETAANGIEGLMKVAERHYDVVLSDMHMPVMDGIAFYRHALRQDPDIKGRFLFMTGNPTERHMAFLRENNLRYFVKPVSLLDLEEAVSGIINRTREQQGAGQ